MSDFSEKLEAKVQHIEEILAEYLPKEEGFQKTVISASNYSVNAGGKRLRPMIMEETYKLFDGKGKQIEPFMAAIEMIHSSSLVHDDLPCMDNDTMRRGKPSTWYQFGEAMGVLAGDALMIYAFETASKAFSMTVNTKEVGRAIRILAEKTGIYGMIGGQTLDVEKNGQNLSPEELDFIYKEKTSALIQCSMMVGAVLAGASEEDIRTCELIAEKVGIAFQIQDDILDIESTTEVLGKPVGSDARNEKSTFATIYGLYQSKEAVRQLSEEAVELLHHLSGENEFLEELLLSLITRTK